MNIQLSKFGTTLTSRQLGKEAYNAFLPSLNDVKETENIFVDFSGVNTFSPSWGDEFLTNLVKKYNNRLIILNSNNLSVKSTLKLLEDINKFKFNIEN